jgi:hypothetical protein
MPLKKILFKPGVNKENTRYTTEGGWYECDKVRFRQGSPEKIGGWQQFSSSRFLGVCRSLWNWVTLGGANLVGVGTNLKFYIEQGAEYYDITPIRSTTAAGEVTFAASNGSSTITVTDNNHGAYTGDFVTFSGVSASGLGAGGNITEAVLEQNYQIAQVLTANTYTIVAKNPTTGAAVTANANDSGNGGASVVGAYEIHVGAATQVPFTGWGAGSWGAGTWGVGGTTPELIRLWSQANFGEDLLFAYRGSQIYYWDSSAGTSNRGVLLSSLGGASGVPTTVNKVFVSDVYRFAMAFGANDIGSGTLDPMLIRWSDQESAVNWTPSATNQAGSLRLSSGSTIVAVIQSRQEIIVITDSAFYSLQYLGPQGGVWGATLLADNISIQSPNAVAFASGIVYWMGIDKFYYYDGRVQTLPCDLRRFIFNDINLQQTDQIFAGTSEGFTEVWWFYPTAGSSTIDQYVIYNYLEKAWYYGTLARTAWLDSGLQDYPIAATYTNNLVYHEFGVNDNETGTPAAIEAYISSSEFDIDDGHNFGFIWRMLPDITFEGSSASNPQAVFTLQPMKGSGSGFTSPASAGGTNFATVTRTATVPIEAFTNIIYTRVRARQLIFKVASTELNTTWQLGAPRIDIRPDGRR